MLTAQQYKKVLFLYDKEYSIRKINAITGHSRNTIRKITKNRTPQTFNTPVRPSKLDNYKSYIESQSNAGVLSKEQIFNNIIEKGYDGSFSLLRRFLSGLTSAKNCDSKKRKRKNRKKNDAHIKWIMELLQGKISCSEVKQEFSEQIDSESIQNLYQQIHEKPLRYRNRAIVVLANCKNIPHRRIAEILRIQRNTVREYLKKFELGGYADLFDFSRKKIKKFEDPKYRTKVFKMITGILSKLKPTESFFSIDEFGPFAIKLQGGRSWIAPGENKIVPQFQKSKGCLILTAALDLSTNQVTHFYSPKKNTDEMIKLLNILLEQYKEQEKIYLSWDAASWHASKKLYEKVDEVNAEIFRCIHKTPYVELAPLPACAQFLNVIESVFSGMAKAIIHNSNYTSVEECMNAIDLYFLERNRTFKENPKRAGNKIWGKEITKATFSESNNCKDPNYMRC